VKLRESELPRGRMFLMALSALSVAAAIVAALVSTAAASPADDISAIREVEARQAEAWNSHDARAYSNLFTADADVVNVLGWWWQGRTRIESRLSDAFAFVFAASRLTIIQVDVRFLSSDIAIAHVGWTMMGARRPAGPVSTAPEIGIQTQVLKRLGNRWLIAVFQNTNALPERPFPKAPIS
jgi:uncharacterized protein (TIGR02246 family)